MKYNIFENHKIHIIRKDKSSESIEGVLIQVNEKESVFHERTEIKSDCKEQSQDCDHPIEFREHYHDSSIVCNKCNCVIEQDGEPIVPPSKLGC
jgi:hypothetical protein